MDTEPVRLPGGEELVVRIMLPPLLEYLDNPTEFYKIAARLIPAAREISGREGGPLEHRSIREYSTEAL